MSNCNCNCTNETKNIQTDKTQASKVVSVDLLYLDLSVCTRCQGTEAGLDDSLDSVMELLNNIGYEVQLNKIHIEIKEQAIKNRFISSPTIRVNGQDIQMEVKESHCSTCSSLTDDASVDCRIWLYNNVEYSVPPKEMIVDAILKEIYGSEKNNIDTSEYTMPENLVEYFENKNLLCAKVSEQDCCSSDCC